MKKLIYTFIIVLFFNTLNAQWVQIPSGTSENLNDIQFVDANTGFAVGNAGIVLKTTNGGNNWTIIYTGNSNNNYCQYFVSPSTGYIGTVNCKIIRTVNSGNSWDTIKVFNSEAYTVSSIYFTTQSTGFSIINIPPHGGILLKTTNSGLNWNISQYYATKSLYFINSDIGWCIANPNASSPYYILRTANAGINWSSSSGGFTYNLKINALHFATSTIGFASSDSGKIFKSIDGGANWSILGSYTSSKLNSIKAIDINKVITVGSNGVIKATSNGGTNWVNQNSTTSNNLNSLYMVNSNLGFIAGDVGTILKTTNGGTYIKKIEEIIPHNYELQQNYPNPFNPRTTIRFSIPKQGFVKITVYNLNGKIISTLVENVLSTGTYETTFDASEHSSGVYYIKFDAGNTSITKKMSLIK